MLFDLDGTLLNSLDDLADAANTVLGEMNYPMHPIESYRQFVGNGARFLLTRALPEGCRQEKTVQDCLLRFMMVYQERFQNKSMPYQGVTELLETLFLQEIPVGIVTNKPHDIAVSCVGHYFKRIKLEHVLGQSEKFPKKPHPSATLQLCTTLDIDPRQSLFIGDSGVDMETAVQAGMKGIGVLWGFRSRDELIDAGAFAVVEHPAEILDICGLSGN